MIIGFEDLVANAFIELVSKKDIREISVRKLETYGSGVIGVLKKKNIPAILSLSRDNTNQFFIDYAAYFSKFRVENDLYIRLNDNITDKFLIERFRGYLPLDVLVAFKDESCFDLLL